MLETLEFLLKEKMLVDLEYIKDNKEKIYEVDMNVFDGGAKDYLPIYCYGINDKLLLYGYQVLKLLEDYELKLNNNIYVFK